MAKKTTKELIGDFIDLDMQLQYANDEEAVVLESAMEVTKKELSKLKRTSRYLIWFDKKDEYDLQRDNLNLTVFFKNKKYEEESYYKCTLLGEQENIQKKLKRISLFLQDKLDIKMSKNKI